jgi:hypothetical protein
MGRPIQLGGTTGRPVPLIGGGSAPGDPAWKPLRYAERTVALDHLGTAGINPRDITDAGGLWQVTVTPAASPQLQQGAIWRFALGDTPARFVMMVRIRGISPGATPGGLGVTIGALVGAAAAPKGASAGYAHRAVADTARALTLASDAAWLSTSEGVVMDWADGDEATMVGAIVGNARSGTNYDVLRASSVLARVTESQIGNGFAQGASWEDAENFSVAVCLNFNAGSTGDTTVQFRPEYCILSDPS